MRGRTWADERADVHCGTSQKKVPQKAFHGGKSFPNLARSRDGADACRAPSDQFSFDASDPRSIETSGRTASGARRLTRGASARALRRTPANNMARRIGMGGRLEQRLCSLPSVSPFQSSSRSAAGSRGRTSIKQPCDRPQRCQRVTPVELPSLVCHSASSARLGAELEKSKQPATRVLRAIFESYNKKIGRNPSVRVQSPIPKAKLQKPRITANRSAGSPF